MTVHRFDHVDAIGLLLKFALFVIALRYGIAIYRVVYFPL